MSRARRPLAATAAAVCLGLLPGAAAAAGPAPVDSDPHPLTPKIVQGEKAVPGDWPTMTAVLYSAVPDGPTAQFCGGTLLAPTWVLTAAHCLVDGRNQRLPAREVQVAVGVTDLRAIGPAQRVGVADVVVHESYDHSRFPYDIALLRLDRPLGGPVQRLAVPGLELLTSPGAPATIVGWDSTSPDQKAPQYPTDLQQADLPVVSDAACAQRLGGAVVPALNVCAGSGTPSDVAADTCYGDSGGPLMVADPRGGSRQAGLTSFGPTCGNAPTAYSDTVAYAGWVESHSGVDLNTFRDTGASVHEPAVERAALLGVAGGYPDGLYRPGDPVTREQAASLVARAAGVVPTADDAVGGFPDVDGTHRAAVNALTRLGVVKGRADGLFGPRDQVRRDQLASFVARTLELRPVVPSGFPDVAPESPHNGTIGALAAAKVIEGGADGLYHPEQAVSRGQTASILVRGFLADGAVGPAPGAP